MAVAVKDRIAPAAAAGSPVKGVIHVTCSELRRALDRVKGAIRAQPKIGALEAVRIAGFEEAGTACLEVHGWDACAKIELEAKVKGEIDVLVSCRALRDTIKPFNKVETLSLRPLKGGLEVRSGRTRVSVVGARRDDWPPMDPLLEHERRTVVHAVGSELAYAVKTAATMASQDETRPVLTAIRLEGEGEGQGSVVASDSYRLATIPLPGVLCSFGVSVRQELAYALRGLRADEGVVLKESDQGRWLIIERAGETWTVRTIDGQYPNWRQVYPENVDVVFHADVDELLEAARKAAKSQGATGNRPVRIKIAPDRRGEAHPGTVTLYTLHEGVASFTWSGEGRVEASGPYQAELELGACPEFLVSMLAACPEPEVHIGFLTPLRPMRFECGDVKAILMPIRLDKAPS